jgi:ribose transport system substrate-binding protein
MARIAEQAGVEFIEFPNQGQPSQWVQGINQAIAQNVDLIVLQAAPNPEALQPQLQQAEDAGIPVLLAHLLPEGDELPPTIDGAMPVPFHEAARAEIDYAVMESGAETNVLIITSTEVVPSDGIVAAMQEQLAARCPDCKATVVNVPVTEWPTIQGEVQSALVADPTINWVIPIYDSMSQFAAPGITAAGREGEVRISTFNGTPFVLEMMQDADIVAMDIGESLDWIAYANMDQAFRLLAGMEPLETENLPLRVFDDSNVDETGTPPTFTDGYGDSYVTGYEELWGLSG